MSETFNPEQQEGSILNHEIKQGIIHALRSDFAQTLEHKGYNPTDTYLRRYIILENGDKTFPQFYAAASVTVDPLLEDGTSSNTTSNNAMDIHLIDTNLKEYMWLSLDPTDIPWQRVNYIFRARNVRKSPLATYGYNIFLDSMGYEKAPEQNCRASDHTNRLFRFNDVLKNGRVSLGMMRDTEMWLQKSVYGGSIPNRTTIELNNNKVNQVMEAALTIDLVKILK